MTTFVQSRDVQQILDNLGLHFIERFAGRRVLVSGGLGFLGRYFAAVFQAMNDGPLQGREVEVRLVDNCIASGAAAAPKPTRWITSRKADVAELREPYGGLDYVLHCAGIASPFYYRRFPLETVDAALSVRSVLEVARRNAGCRVAFFSSSEIYGDPDPKHVPTPESYRGNVSCLGPRSVYDESKRMGETLVRAYQQQYGVHGTIIRPFNVYGPGMQHTDYRVLPNFAAHILKDEPVRAYGDGHQTRTYCYVSDAIGGFLRVLLDGIAGEPYNIGNPTPEISVLELARTIGRVLERDIKIDVVEHPDSYPADEPQRRCPDITKARTLGYEPKVGLEEGLARFFSWAKEAYPK